MNYIYDQILISKDQQENLLMLIQQKTGELYKELGSLEDLERQLIDLKFTLPEEA